MIRCNLTLRLSGHRKVRLTVYQRVGKIGLDTLIFLWEMVNEKLH
jgi:hypothetical protein